MASASDYSPLVQELYVAYFGRPADYFGLQNFEAALLAASAPTDIAGLVAAYSTNTAVKSLIDSFGTSAESAALYGSGSTESFVTAIFENLLNRAPAVGGLSFWVNAINSGTVTKGDAALAIAAGAQSNTTPQGVIDGQTIANKLAVAANFTTDLAASSLDIVAYSGSAAAAAARGLIAGVTSTTVPTTYEATVQTTITGIVNNHVNNTYNLTTGVDTIVGGPGNSVYNAVLDNTLGLSAGGQAATLTSFDTITGGTLNNTLNITDFGLSGQMVLPSATITGITTVNVNSLEGIGQSGGSDSALDFSSLGTLTNVNINASYGNDYVKVGANTALVVTDTSNNNVYTYGGSTVTVNNSSTSGAYGNYVEVQGGSATTAVTINYGYDDTDYIYDANHGSGKANTITTVSINNQVDYDTYIYSDALTQLNLTGISYHYVYDYAAAGTRTLNVALNNDGNASSYSSDYWFLESDQATTVVVTTATVASKNAYFYMPVATSLTFNDAVNLSFFDGATAGSNYLEAAAAKSVTITGAGNFTADLSGLNAAAVINAAGSTGVVTVEMASASGGALTQSFTGGSGQDIVTVGAGQTGTVAGGAAINNEIVLDNIAGASATTLTPYTHFSILGVAGTTSGVFDMNKAAGYTSFDVQDLGGSVTFTNAATNSSLSIEGNVASPYIVTLQTVDTTGSADTAHVTLGVAGGSSLSINQITLEDAILYGTGTVDLVVNTNSDIATFGDNNLVTLKISGAGTLHVDNSIADVSTSLTINNTAGSSSTSYIGGVTDNFLTSLTIGGSEGVYLNGLTSTSTALTITDSDTNGFYLSSLADTALTTATFANTVNTTAGTFVIGNTITEASLTTLNLNGNVQLSLTGDTVTSGVTVSGSTDNASVTIDLTAGAGTGTGKTDSITLGNGAGDTVHLSSGLAGSSQSVTLGSGANDVITTTSLGTVTLTVGSATSGTDHITADSASTVHITAGNGTDVISATATGASITIAAGTGSNSITIGTDTSGTISFGAHTTGTDTVSLGASGTSLTAIEKISGLNDSITTTDTIVFSGETANTLVGFTEVTAGSVVASHGNTTLLSSWVAAADGATGSAVAAAGATPGAAHGITWFVFQGNTYILESVAGAAADAGTMVATNTLVELVGTGYTFAHTTGTTGHLALLG